MSKSLKDDIMKAILNKEAESRIYSNDTANQKVDWSKAGMQMLDNFKEVHLYNVQFKIDTHKSVRLVNKFVYAYDRADAINLVIKKYQNFKVDIDDVYCQRVDARRGMMFSNN